MNIFDKAQAQEPDSDNVPGGPETGPEPDGDEGMDPEQSPEYMQAKELLLSKLYEEGAAQGLGKAMKVAPDPVQGLVDQTMALLDVMEQATQGSVPDELVMSFVVETTQEVAEIAEQAGVKLSGKQVAEAVREILAKVIETLGGDSTAIREEMGQLDPEEVGRAAMGEGDGA